MLLLLGPTKDRFPVSRPGVTEDPDHTYHSGILPQQTWPGHVPEGPEKKFDFLNRSQVTGNQSENRS